MNMLLRTLLTIFLLMTQSQSLFADNTPLHDSQRYNQVLTALEQAEQRRNESAKLGYEWSTIQPLIQTARQHLNEGNLQSALSLAQEAQAHADLAIAQAVRSGQNWVLELPVMPNNMPKSTK